MSREQVEFLEQDTVRTQKPTPLPRQIQPMLCTLVSEPFDDPNWLFESKFDGQRVLARFDGKKVELTFQQRGAASRDRRSLGQTGVGRRDCLRRMDAE